MPKLNATPRANLDPETARYQMEVARQVNALSEGRMAAKYTAMTAAPTTGTWARGDTVANSAPAEAGSASSKYVVFQWICTVGGTPGTWVACRALTGN